MDVRLVVLLKIRLLGESGLALGSGLEVLVGEGEERKEEKPMVGGDRRR